MNKEQLAKALITLNETISFCRDELDALIELRKLLRQLHETASDTSVLCLIGQTDPFEHLNQMYQAAKETELLNAIDDAWQAPKESAQRVKDLFFKKLEAKHPAHPWTQTNNDA